MAITPEAAAHMASSLPGADHRWEITPEGNLVIMAPANITQSKIVMRMIGWFLHGGFNHSQLLAEVGIHTVGEAVRGPDLMVFATEPEGVGPWAATDSLLLVIEILSPSTRRTDQYDKMTEYATAGITRYWIVDPAGANDALVHMYALGTDRRYSEAAPSILLSELENDDPRHHVS